MFTSVILQCLLLLLVVAQSGCASAPIRWMTGKPSPQQEVADKSFAEIAPAIQRIDRVKYLGGKIRNASTEEKAQIAAELTEQFGAEQDALVRAEILTTLAKLGDQPVAASTIANGLQDGVVEVRVAACAAQRIYGGDDAEAVLGRIAMEDESADVRLAALRELGRMRSPEAIEAIAPALASRDPAIQYRAVQSLRATAPVDHGNDVAAWRDYVQSGNHKSDETSIAQRLRRVF